MAALALFLLLAVRSSAAVVPEPETDLDRVFAAYGTGCFGMDWRILKGVAKAESDLDPGAVNPDYPKYKGLFQESKTYCEDNIGRFARFLDCDDLLDPETNTAAAASKIDEDMRKILKACPDMPLKDLILFVYIGHNNGDAVLEYALGERPGDAPDAKPVCRFDSTLTKTVARWYDTGPKKKRNGVDAAWGLRKMKHGMRVVAAVKRAGATSAYPPGASTSLSCPANMGKRLAPRRPAER